MKSTLFILFFFSTNISIAQSYHPFPTGNASWSECSTFYYVVHNTTNYQYLGFRYILENKDTIIQSVKYALVGWQSTWSFYAQINISNNDSGSSTYNSPLISPGQIFGALREDSSKKVWFRRINSNDYFFGASTFLSTLFPLDTDVLIYDFNLKVGDTLKWKSLYNYGFGPVVTSIDSMQLNDNTYRKTLVLNNGESTWIEGIGSTNGLFGAYFGNSEFDPYNGIWFNCFFQNGQNLYNNTIEPTFLTSCDSIFSVSDGVKTLSSNDNISVYPNPVSNELLISSNQLLGAEIEVYDLLGHVLITATVNSPYNKTSIDVKNLANGIYFLTIKDKYGNGTVTKFIKD